MLATLTQSFHFKKIANFCQKLVIKLTSRRRLEVKYNYGLMVRASKQAQPIPRGPSAKRGRSSQEEEEESYLFDERRLP
jgi:hypothetical protein